MVLLGRRVMMQIRLAFVSMIVLFHQLQLRFKDLYLTLLYMIKCVFRLIILNQLLQFRIAVVHGVVLDQAKDSAISLKEFIDGLLLPFIL
jgi:hypothetical protein